MSNSHLHIASYNIHAGIGNDGIFDPQRLIKVIRQLDADVIGLQEVVSLGPDGFALLNELAQSCQMRAIAGPTMMRGDAHYGNALLTRIPVSGVQRYDLSLAGYEPRGALSVELEGSSPLTIVNTHLGLKRKERFIQVKRLLKWLNKLTTPVVLLGDFNEWRPLSLTQWHLYRRFRSVATPRTFPASLPLLVLDRILASPQTTLKTTRAHTTTLTKKASDHLPLVATLNWPHGTGSEEKSRVEKPGF